MFACDLLITLLLATTPAAHEPPSDDEVLRLAETAFQEGIRARDNLEEAQKAFARAAAHYDELRRREFESAALYRNQGNAYLLADDPAQAILAYRRGLRLAPDDPGLRAPLDDARERFVYVSPGSPVRPPSTDRPLWLPRLAPAWGVGFVALFYGMACVGVTRWLMTRKAWLLGVAAAAFALALLLAADLAIDERARYEDKRHPLVIVARDGVFLHKGNGWSYPRREDLPLSRGVEARLLFTRGEWVQVELAGGDVGWLPRAHVLLAAP